MTGLCPRCGAKGAKSVKGYQCECGLRWAEQFVLVNDTPVLERSGNFGLGQFSQVSSWPDFERGLAKRLGMVFRGKDRN